MDFHKVELFFTCVVAFYGLSYGEDCNNDLTSKSSAVKLSHELFCSYEKTVRPVINQSTQIIVDSTLFVFNVYMEEEWNVLQMSVQLLMSWKDEFLVWDPSKYDNIDFIHANSKTIWVPDVISYDTGYLGDNSQTSNFLPESIVKINSAGQVKYNHRLTLSAQCSANVAKWPFDSHNCSFLVGSPVYTNKYVNYTFPKSGYYDMDYYNPDREWKVIEMNHKCVHLNYSKDNASYTHCLLQYDITIERYSLMYYSSVIIPAIVISLMRTFTYLMGRECTLRIVLLCLFFISELLYLQLLDIKIPNNGELFVYIILLYRNSLILTAVAIVICVLSNELYKRGTEDFPRNPPEWIKSVSTFLLNKRPIMLLTNFNNQGAELLIERNVEEETPNSQRDENGLFWKTLSILLDRLFFIITLFISMINFWFLIP